MSYKYEVMISSFPGGVAPASYEDLVKRVRLDAGIITASITDDGWRPRSYGTSIELIFDTEPTAGEKALIDGHVSAAPGNLPSVSHLSSMELEDADASVDERVWSMTSSAGGLIIGTNGDSGAAASSAIEATRTGTAVDQVDIKAPLVVTGEVTASAPTSGSSLTTKDYVDSLAQGMEWQDSVTSVLDDPPGSPTAGLRHLVGTGTGAWAGKDDQIAEGDGAAWGFTVPTQGMTVVTNSPPGYLNYNGSSWVSLGSAVVHANLQIGADEHPEYVLADGTREFSSAPTMPGASCTADLNIDSALPRLQFHDSDGVSDETRFRFYVASGQLICAHVTDDQATTTAIQTWRKAPGTGDVTCGITADVSITGDLAVTGTVDGRDVAADGTALDALASHAATHADGGSDELKVEDLATAGTLGQVPTSDGAGGLTMEDAAGGSVFGTEFNLVEASNQVSFQSNETDLLRVPSSGDITLPAGTYKIELHLECHVDDDAQPVQFRIKRNGTTVEGNVGSMLFTSDVYEDVTKTIIRYVTVTAGDYHWQSTAKQKVGSNYGYISERSMTIHRVS
jgi:hypothetical protein